MRLGTTSRAGYVEQNYSTECHKCVMSVEELQNTHRVVLVDVRESPSFSTRAHSHPTKLFAWRIYRPATARCEWWIRDIMKGARRRQGRRSGQGSRRPTLPRAHSPSTPRASRSRGSDSDAGGEKRAARLCDIVGQTNSEWAWTVL